MCTAQNFTLNYMSNFATKQKIMTHIVMSALHHIQFWIFFPNLAKMVYSMGGCVAVNDLWPSPISKYVTFSCVHSTAHAILNGFFAYVAQMIISIRRCVVYNELWSSTIFSRSFSYDLAIKLTKIWHISPCVLYSVYIYGWIISVFGTNDQ